MNIDDMILVSIDDHVVEPAGMFQTSRSSSKPRAPPRTS